MLTNCNRHSRWKWWQSLKMVSHFSNIKHLPFFILTSLTFLKYTKQSKNQHLIKDGEEIQHESFEITNNSLPKSLCIFTDDHNMLQNITFRAPMLWISVTLDNIIPKILYLIMSVTIDKGMMLEHRCIKSINFFIILSVI